MSIYPMPKALSYFTIDSHTEQNVEGETVWITDESIAYSSLHYNHWQQLKNRTNDGDVYILFRQRLDEMVMIWQSLDLNSLRRYHQRANDNVGLFNTLIDSSKDREFASRKSLRAEKAFTKDNLNTKRKHTSTQNFFTDASSKVVLKQRKLILFQQAGLLLSFGVVIFLLFQVKQTQQHSKKQLAANFQVVFISHQFMNSVSNVIQENFGEEQLLNEYEISAINPHSQRINSEIINNAVRSWRAKTDVSIDRPLQNTIHPVKSSLNKQHILVGNADALVGNADAFAKFFSEITEDTKKRLTEMLCEKAVPYIPNKDDLRKINQWCKESKKKR
jgi:hypothetical protein